MKLITSQGGRLLTLSDMLREGPCVAAACVVDASSDVPSFSTGLQALDALAPGGAFRRGVVHEILADPADGTPLFFAMLLARAAKDSGAIVWCDPGSEIYPPALAAPGIDLDRLFLRQPKPP